MITHSRTIILKSNSIEFLASKSRKKNSFSKIFLQKSMRFEFDVQENLNSLALI